jgi:hypothetical protein
VEDEAGVNGEGSGGRGICRGAFLDWILRRIAQDHAAEGALGDIEEGARMRGQAGMARRGAGGDVGPQGDPDAPKARKGAAVVRGGDAILGRDLRPWMADEARMSGEGSGRRERGSAFLERVLFRLTGAEIAEGALGDLEETPPSDPGGGTARRRQRTFERLCLVIAFGRERIACSLGERLRALTDTTLEEGISKMGAEAGKTGLWLLGRWILASAVGWAGGLAAAVALFLAVQALVGLDSDRFLAFAALACLGVGLGVAQSIVIGPLLARPRDWFWATLAGHVIAMIVLVVPWFRRYSGPEIVGNAAMLALIGAAIGATQWWVLRRRFHAAGVWAPATLLGFMSFLWVILNPVSDMARFVEEDSVAGAAASVLPGVVLVWLVWRERAGAAPDGAQASGA